MIDWDASEQDAMIRLLRDPMCVSALTKFLNYKRHMAEQNCAMNMCSAPRRIELASDYAAKAEAYQTLLRDLEAEAHRVPVGPTE